MRIYLSVELFTMRALWANASVAAAVAVVVLGLGPEPEPSPPPPHGLQFAPLIFNHSMVLQRDAATMLWGSGAHPGAGVVVTVTSTEGVVRPVPVHPSNTTATLTASSTDNPSAGQLI